MRKLAFGTGLALVVYLLTAAVPARATDETTVEAPPAAADAAKTARPIKPVGSEVPDMSLLTRKTLMSLGAVSLLFLLVTGTYKRFADKRGTVREKDEIAVLARKPVGQRHALLLVEVGGQRFLLGQGSETFTLISELEQDSLFRDILGESLDVEQPRKIAAEG